MAASGSGSGMAPLWERCLVASAAFNPVINIYAQQAQNDIKLTMN